MKIQHLTSYTNWLFQEVWHCGLMSLRFCIAAIVDWQCGMNTGCLLVVLSVLLSSNLPYWVKPFWIYAHAFPLSRMSRSSWPRLTEWCNARSYEMLPILMTDKPGIRGFCARFYWLRLQGFVTHTYEGNWVITCLDNGLSSCHYPMILFSSRIPENRALIQYKDVILPV